METIIGPLGPAMPVGASPGESSQPCTSYPSSCQVRLCATTGTAGWPAFARVRSCQWPIGPASSSGGRVKLWWIAAAMPPPQVTPRSPRRDDSVSGPLQSGCCGSAPPPNARISASGPASAVAVRPGGPPAAVQDQDRPVMLACRLGVRLCRVALAGSGWSSARRHASPPVEPKSLMMPPMKATVRPSGETVGDASCWRCGGV